MALPSFQSVFVPGCSEKSSEPDSDFEYDIFSDCSSNVPSPFHCTASPISLGSCASSGASPVQYAASNSPEDENLVSLTVSAPLSPSPSPSSSTTSLQSDFCPYDLHTLLATAWPSGGALAAATAAAAHNSSEQNSGSSSGISGEESCSAGQSSVADLLASLVPEHQRHQRHQRHQQPHRQEPEHPYLHPQPDAGAGVGIGVRVPLVSGIRSRRRMKVASHVCVLCKKAFHTPSQLDEHCIYRHSEERKHQCDQCQKVFKTRSNLNQHVRTHLGAKQPCPQCGRRFTESGLRYHLLTHKAEKRFPCPYSQCGMSFVQNKLLQKHLGSKHSQLRHFPCPHCPLAFKRQDHLSRHVSDTHSFAQLNLFECGICGGRYQSANRLRQHEKLHQEPGRFQCQSCGRNFRKRNSLEAHMRKIHNSANATTTSTTAPTTTTPMHASLSPSPATSSHSEGSFVDPLGLVVQY